MTASKAAIRWCAIYTRKSSEEGLDQAFNSLDAQREACPGLYPVSGRPEGWRALPPRSMMTAAILGARSSGPH